jgi:O-antigen/teichoic acid export membrane protein
LFQPNFAARRGFAERLSAVRQSLCLVTAICGATTAGFVAVADLLVPLLLGPLWMPAAVIAILLALAGFARAVAAVHTSLLSVSNRNGRLFRIFTVSGIAGLAGMVVAAPFGGPVVAGVVLLRVILTCGVLAREAAEDSGGAPFRLHLKEVLVPFLIMVGVALGGRSVFVAVGSEAASVGPAVGAILAASASAGLVGLLLLLRLRIAPRRVAA